MTHYGNGTVTYRVVFYTALSVNEVLANKRIAVVPQPPHLSDLRPHGLFLFSKIKSHIEGHHFGTVASANKVVTN